MKINNLYTGIVLAGALMVSGCGSDDDGEYVGGGSGNGGPIVNNEFKYTEYYAFSDVNDDYKTAWGKIRHTLTKSSSREEISTVVGSSPTAYQDSIKNDENSLSYYAGNNFFIGVTKNFDSKYYKTNFIDKDTFELKIQKDSATINSTYDILTYDLSGVGKIDNETGIGIYTDLNYFDYFPDSLTFPQGSKCYVLQETSQQSYYSFSNKSTNNRITVEEWLQHKRRLGYEVNNVIQEKVGQNNSLSAIRFNENSGEIFAAVEFNGLVYEADYLQQGVKEFLHTDPKTEQVECYKLNDTAANFFENQIKANYKK